jgi:hypothetical protein
LSQAAGSGKILHEVSMGNCFQVLAGMVLIVVGHSFAAAGEPQAANPSQSFAVATVHLEQNATDGDFEVVFEAKGGADGLTKLTIVSPDGRTIVDTAAPDKSTLGMRQFRFESPEPPDFKQLTSAYPEGVYTFTGVTAAGTKLQGKSTLNHRLPGAASFQQPGANAQNVAVKNMKITWAPVKNVAGYIVYVEQGDLNVTARVLPSVTSFVVPDGFLIPGKEYQIGIGTVSEAGNISFVETSFTTASAPTVAKE